MLKSGGRSRLLLVRNLAAAAGLVLATASVTLVTGVHSAGAAGGITVSVGYADDLRAATASFPTPWEGTAGVVFAGCAPRPACVYDAGAVKIDNNTGGAVTVDRVVIRFDTCVYDIWPHGIALPAGERLIVTQNASGGGNGCEPGTGLMDSSDIGPGGALWAGHCDDSHYLPVVEVTINGQTSAFTDRARVLNTGGIDIATCQNANESLQWSEIGQTNPCPSSQLTLAPPTQLRGVGSPATLVATYTNSCGEPLPGVTVDFAASSGPNVGGLGSAITDVNGVATVQYTSSTPGTDTVQASIANAVGSIPSNQVTVVWNSPPTVHVPASVSGDEGSPIPLNGTATDPDGPSLTRSWSYTLGPDVDPGTTCAFADPSAAATSITCTDNGTVTATLTASDGLNTPVSAGITVHVANLAPSATVSAPGNDSLYVVGSAVNLTAPFTDPGTNDTHTCTIAWDDGQPAAAGTVAETPGSGTCTASRTFTAAGVYSIVVTVTDDNGGSATAPVTVVVYDPNGGFVTGGGTIASPAGAYTPNPALTGKANFGFVSKYHRGTTVPDGETEFQFQTAGLNFHSSAYQWLVVSGAKAQYKGTGTINGMSGYTFLLTATDGDQAGGGGPDRFRIKIWNSGGVVYDNSLGSPDDIDVANPQVLLSGSIVIHKT